VLLAVDKQLPGDEGLIPAGTWAPGWLDRDTWRRRGDRWEALVRYTLYGRTFPFSYLSYFDESSIRRADGTASLAPTATRAGDQPPS